MPRESRLVLLESYEDPKLGQEAVNPTFYVQIVFPWLVGSPESEEQRPEKSWNCAEIL